MNPESFVISYPVSPLWRVFDDDAEGEAFSALCGLRNEPLSFSLAYRSTAKKGENKRSPDTPISVRVISSLPVAVYKTCKVAYAAAECEDAKSGTPGGCPDMLLPRNPAPKILRMPWDKGLPYYEENEPHLLNAACFATQSVLIEINPEGKPLPAGDHTVTVEVIGLMSGSVLQTHTLSVHLIDALLPENDLIYTNWFHYDCLSDLTHLKVWSDEYFTVLGRHLQNATQNGMNTLLFPTFTPPLDTPIGGERMNVQLVKITEKDGEYSFDFSLAERFVRVAKEAGIRTLEHTHLFSQWGAENAITVFAERDGECYRLFDHNTPATDEKYVRFLGAYLTSFLDFAKKTGIEKDILYHISDEPVLASIEGYRRAKELMRSVFPNGKFADALDDYEFYKQGLVEMPIVDVQSVDGYDGRCDNMMLYYTGGEGTPGLVNRTLTSAPQRTRALGYVLYRYDAKGFLNWGYNYYYGRLSSGCHHPATDPCFYKSIPACSYLVYPDTDGSPLPSLREKQMLAAMSDYRALRLLESLIGREETMALCKKMLGERIDPTTVCKTGNEHLAFRAAVNERIEKSL